MNINQLYNEETNRLQLKILFPITYLLIFLSIFISTIYDYKNLRGKKDSNLPDLQYFIVIFIILILINLVVYLILGAIFLACKRFLFNSIHRIFFFIVFRGIRECTSSISLRIFLLIFFGINLIIISFSWWFFGNVIFIFFFSSPLETKANNFVFRFGGRILSYSIMLN